MSSSLLGIVFTQVLDTKPLKLCKLMYFLGWVANTIIQASGEKSNLWFKTIFFFLVNVCFSYQKAAVLENFAAEDVEDCIKKGLTKCLLLIDCLSCQKAAAQRTMYWRMLRPTRGHIAASHNIRCREQTTEKLKSLLLKVLKLWSQMS